MISLFDSPQFKKDYKNYQEEIRNIKDEKAQAELVTILKEFVEQVKLIDRFHSELNLSNRIPTAINEARSNLASCKKKLDSKISNFKSVAAKNQA
jgi:sulfur relay (sulfurtransferase) DsrC/TusE family protein